MRTNEELSQLVRDAIASCPNEVTRVAAYEALAALRDRADRGSTTPRRIDEIEQEVTEIGRRVLRL